MKGTAKLPVYQPRPEVIEIVARKDSESPEMIVLLGGIESCRGRDKEALASVLAMQCFSRGLTLDGVELFVKSADESLKNRAIELLEMGTAWHRRKISRREREVLAFLAQNKMNKEIGSELNIAERTVKFHVHGLFQKFGVRDRATLISKAISEGLVREGL